MLTITIPAVELYDESKGEFTLTKEVVLNLEHSLVSVSKWESKWKVSFLSQKSRTTEESVDYIKCMTITQNIPDAVYDRLTVENIRTINEYISDTMTATFIPQRPGQQTSREKVTSELIYYWMVAYNIPFECQKWHINRLLTLIRICDVKNNPPKKTSPKELASRNRSLNKERRAAMNSKG